MVLAQNGDAALWEQQCNQNAEFVNEMSRLFPASE